jgi:hypothetical protein
MGLTKRGPNTPSKGPTDHRATDPAKPGACGNLFRAAPFADLATGAIGRTTEGTGCRAAGNTATDAGRHHGDATDAGTEECSGHFAGERGPGMLFLAGFKLVLRVGASEMIGRSYLVIVLTAEKLSN